MRDITMPIRSYLHDLGVFDPDTVRTMSSAFEQACAALSLAAHDTQARGAVAARIIALARSGVLEADELRDRVLQERKPSA
jgi:hypothetical protein